MTTLTTTEVLDDRLTTVLEDSPMTDAEQKQLVIVKTQIITAYASKLDQDLAIGAALLQIFRRKLYRGESGGRTWKQWLIDESAELTCGRGPIGEDTSQRLRGFYKFRCEVLQSSAKWPTDGIPLPASPAQVRPLLGQLDSYPEAALEMWKAACAQAGKGNLPTFDQVNRAALAYKANQANEARRLSAEEQAKQINATAASLAARQQPQPAQDRSPQPTTQPTIPAWDIQRDDSALDAAAECRKVTSAITDAARTISTLRGILYTQVNTYGRDYLGFLRQVDAGVYSLHDIDNQIAQLAEDVHFISELLTADVGEGELAQSTIDINSFPTR